MLLVLYNTIDNDVALAYLTTATVTTAVVDMIMSLVNVHKNKKVILNIVHKVESYADGNACFMGGGITEGNPSAEVLIRGNGSHTPTEESLL